MPAYIIGLRKANVKDTEAMAEYQRRTRAMTPAAKLIPKIVYGEIQSLEGEAPDGVVVLEFATKAEAKAWYDNPEYQAAIPFRQQAADYDMFIVEGLGS